LLYEILFFQPVCTAYTFLFNTHLPTAAPIHSSTFANIKILKCRQGLTSREPIIVLLAYTGNGMMLSYNPMAPFIGISVQITCSERWFEWLNILKQLCSGFSWIWYYTALFYPVSYFKIKEGNLLKVIN
jgi:hypothetical protein